MISICAGYRHATTCGLRYLIKRRSPGVGTIRTIAGNGAGNDGRIDLLETFVINFQSLRNTGAKIADYYIRLTHKVIKNRQPFFVFQINGDAFFVAVERNEIGSHAINGVAWVIRQQLACSLTKQGFNFDGLCT